jgi:hypothetical protein
MLVGRLEVFGHLRLEVVIAVVAMHAAGFFGMGVDVDRHDVFDTRQLQSGHFSVLAAGRPIVQPWELIMSYNKLARQGSGQRKTGRGFPAGWTLPAKKAQKYLFGLTFDRSMA